MTLTLAELFRTLDHRGVPYVVIRNWQNLPNDVAVGPHSDLDLLVHPEAKTALLEAWGATSDSGHPAIPRYRVTSQTSTGEPTAFLVDVRTADDDYFPRDLANAMLEARVRHGTFYALPPREHILGLMYHAVHHLGVMAWDYRGQILELAPYSGLAIETTRLFDFSYCSLFLEAHNVRPVAARDPSVVPFMPFIHPLDRVISSRLCTEHLGRKYHSRVYRVGAENGTVIRKQASVDLADREFSFLADLDAPFFPKPLGRSKGPNSTVVDIEFVAGPSLESREGLAMVTRSLETAKTFFHGCLDVLEILQEHGITHRDLRNDNLLVRDGLPVLLDFGWAISSDRPCFAPKGMNGHCSPPDHFCDVYSMGIALKPVACYYPEFAHVVHAMTRPALGERTTRIPRLREMLDNESPSEERLSEALNDLLQYFIGRGEPQLACNVLDRVRASFPRNPTLLRAMGAEQPSKGLPAVSIVISVQDHVESLERCLDALIAATPEDLFEVVIVDNGSTAEMASFLRRLEGDVKIVASEDQVDPARAYNQAAELASGSYLVFLDQEAEVGPGWLAAITDLASGTERVAVSGWLLLDPKGGRNPEPVPALDRDAVDQIRHDRALLMPAEVFRASGGFTSRPEALERRPCREERK